MSELHFFFPKLPPSSNKIYFRGKILQKEAREYRADLKMFLEQNYGPTLNTMRKEAAYALHLRFFFQSLVNTTYQDATVPPSKRAKSWYKRVDLTNRIKFLEDVIRDSVGVDDSHTFLSTQEKLQFETEGVEVWLREIDPTVYWIPAPPIPLVEVQVPRSRRTRVALA